MNKSKKLRSVLGIVTALLCSLLVLTTGCSAAYELDIDAGDIPASSHTESGISDSDDESIPQEVSEDNTDTDSTDIAEAYYTFRSEKLLNEHFDKHNEDFGYADVQEYVDGANRVINDTNSLHKLEAEDGDDVYYLEETNEFVIVSTDGYIRTYFKPSKGIDYYNRQ